MMTYNRAFILIMVVLVLHALGIAFDLYSFFDWYDIPMHFGGGFAAAALGLAIWTEGIEDIRFKGRMVRHLKWWLVPLFVLGIVALISVAWEFHEFLLDQLLSEKPLRQMGLTDTMADFFFDLTGGVIALLVYYRH
ncbi:MAG: hypothetical protein Q8P30_00925 [Candidatus Uhrbacteria bacterium]|nr:hypothetical protein [Candidatus Uhrbacteria bacterium]